MTPRRTSTAVSPTRSPTAGTWTRTSILNDLHESSSREAPFHTTATGQALDPHEVAFVGESVCTVQRVRVGDLTGTWIYSEFDTDAPFESVSEWVDPRNWPRLAPFMFKGMNVVGAPRPLAITGQGTDHWHGVFHEEVQLFNRISALLHCDHWRDGDRAAGMTFELDFSPDGQLDIDRGFITVTNIRLENGDSACRVQALKIVGFTADIWDRFAERVCPWWTDFLRGAVRGSSSAPKPTEPASPPASLDPEDLIGAWTSFFGTSARVYLDLFEDINARAVSGAYSPSDWLADGSRFWSRLAKDWVQAWTYGLEKLPEFTSQRRRVGSRPASADDVAGDPGDPDDPSRPGGPGGPGRRADPRGAAGDDVTRRSRARRPGLLGARARRGRAAGRLRPHVDRGATAHHRRPGRLGDRGEPPRRHARGSPADVRHLRTSSGPLRRHAAADRRRTGPRPGAALHLGRAAAVTDMTTSAEEMLSRLLERLLTAAEASLEAGDLEPARATAEEVRAVDPGNRRAAVILERAAVHSAGSLGQRALVTLLFSDLVGSTLLSERVEPEQLRDLFSSYRAAARDAVTRYGGNLVQFSGDGILAAFGHPDPHEDDARRAVLAGLDLVVAMSDARADLERRLGLAADVRVGIHTGQVVISDLGNDRGVAERDSIVGVVPNLAARIQQAAEPGMVVISDVTRQLVDVDFYMHSLGEQELKGISRPVEVFAVERPRYAAARFDVERYRKAGLVGRESPHEELVSAWEAIRRPGDAEAGSAFVVAGEAGIGKSRLRRRGGGPRRGECRAGAGGCVPAVPHRRLPVADLPASRAGGPRRGRAGGSDPEPW